MVIIAGPAQVSMYWYDYVSSDINGTFTEFIHFRVTTTHLRFRSLDFVVGWFGYVLGLVDFVGFLFGGFVAYFLLESEKQCPSCKLYLDTLGSKQCVVENTDSAAAYLEGFGRLLNGDNTPLATISKSGTASKAGPGSLRISTTLRGCPVCKRQFTEQRVAVFAGNDWKDVDSLARDNEVAAGVDLVPYYARD